MALNKLNIRNAIWLWLGATRRAAPVYCTRAAFSSIVPPIFKDHSLVTAEFSYAFLKESPNLNMTESVLLDFNLHAVELKEPIKDLTGLPDEVDISITLSTFVLQELGFESLVISDGGSVSALFHSISMSEIVLVMDPLSDSCAVSATFHSISLT